MWKRPRMAGKLCEERKQFNILLILLQLFISYYLLFANMYGMLIILDTRSWIVTLKQTC